MATATNNFDFVNLFLFLVLRITSAAVGNDTSKSTPAASFSTIDTLSGCGIDINRHLKKISRLILHPDSSSTNGYRFFLPSAGHNLLTFENGQEVVFACPNGVYEKARCHKGETFKFAAPPREASISQITCRRPLRASVRNLGRCYNNQYNHMGVGLTIWQDQSTNEFIKLVDFCFDPQFRISVYAKFTLMQGIENSQRNVKRSNFNCTSYFGYHTRNFYAIYGRENQYNTLVNLLGSVNQTDKFINRSTSSDLYLTKGHLVAFKDFVYSSQQQVTSFCLNTAPMWQVIRRGNWRNLENSIREYASSKGKDLTVYSGTYGVLKISHDNGSFVPIYLGTDRNGTKVMPVPKLFWKIVYDRLMRQGIVFLGINNHHTDLYPEDYAVCNDVCNRTESWFNGWDRFQIRLGYVYCCTVTDFVKQTNAIPEFRGIVINILT